MNRRHLTIMTIDNHRAAAREMATIHRSVAVFENAIIKIFEDRWRVGRSARWVRDRIRRNLKRVHKSLDRIQTGMEEVQTRTLAGDEQSDSCWRETVKAELSATVEHVTGVPELDQHVAAGRALGPAKPAMNRFLDIWRSVWASPAAAFRNCAPKGCPCWPTAVSTSMPPASGSANM